MTSNQALLISIRPQYVAAIFAETKRVELRRVRPRLSAGDLVIVYESEVTKGIVGAFTVKGVTTAKPENIWRKHGNESGVNKQQFDAYYTGVEVGYAIQIGAAWRLPSPILLATLRKRREGFRPPQSYHYLSLPDMMSLSDEDFGFLSANFARQVLPTNRMGGVGCGGQGVHRLVGGGGELGDEPGQVESRGLMRRLRQLPSRL